MRHSIVVWLWIVGNIKQYGKQDKRLCYIMLQNNAGHQTHWPHPQYPSLCHYKDWATHTSCKVATAKIPWSCSQNAGGRALPKVCPLYTYTWDKKTRSAKDIISVIHTEAVWWWRQYAATRSNLNTGPGPKWMEKICDRLLRSRTMMMTDSPLKYWNATFGCFHLHQSNHCVGLYPFN